MYTHEEYVVNNVAIHVHAHALMVIISVECSIRM